MIIPCNQRLVRNLFFQREKVKATLRRNSHQEKNPKKWKGLQEAGTNNKEKSAI